MPGRVVLHGTVWAADDRFRRYAPTCGAERLVSLRRGILAEILLPIPAFPRSEVDGGWGHAMHREKARRRVVLETPPGLADWQIDKRMAEKYKVDVANHVFFANELPESLPSVKPGTPFFNASRRDFPTGDPPPNKRRPRSSAVTGNTVIVDA